VHVRADHLVPLLGDDLLALLPEGGEDGLLVVLGRRQAIEELLRGLLVVHQVLEADRAAMAVDMEYETCCKLGID
jgi:hypothetical protein